MRIDVNSEIHLSEIGSADKPAYLEYLQEREIYEKTAAIPHPYTETDADEWIAQVSAETKDKGRPWNWAIRRNDGKLIGGIGFRQKGQPGTEHSAEIGYWLAKPFWGRGYATAAVKTSCEHGFAEMGFVRITAHVFESNPASTRVLEKCGFQLEGHLRKCHLKDGRYIDVRLYALVR